MEAYYCKCCKHYTAKLSHFKDHLESLKHFNHTGEEKEITDYSIFKKTLYICPTCDDVYMSNRSLQYHEAKNHVVKDEPLQVKQVQQIKLVKKKKIPQTLRIQVWNKWIGEEIGKTKCLCCKLHDISQLNFNCGHIVAESKGGELKTENLKPICQSCNNSMGTQNMNEFMLEYGF